MMKINPDAGRIELDGRWAGYTFAAGKLVSPENHTFDPADMAWWSLTCAIRHEWTDMMAELKTDQAQRRQARRDNIIWLRDRGQAARKRQQQRASRTMVKVIVVDLGEWRDQHFGQIAG